MPAAASKAHSTDCTACVFGDTPSPDAPSQPAAARMPSCRFTLSGTHWHAPGSPASTPTAPNMWPRMCSPLPESDDSCTSLLTPGILRASLATFTPSEHSTARPP